jgi:hypothetical protein
LDVGLVFAQLLFMRRLISRGVQVFQLSPLYLRCPNLKNNCKIILRSYLKTATDI